MHSGNFFRMRKTISSPYFSCRGICTGSLLCARTKIKDTLAVITYWSKKYKSNPKIIQQVRIQLNIRSQFKIEQVSGFPA